MIIKFKIFEEVKFRDTVIVNRKAPDELKKKFSNKNFNIDDVFLREAEVENHTLRFSWNHSNNHNLYEKIQNRTSIKSISELNDIFLKTIKQIIPSELGKTGKINKDGTYALYLKENKFYFIIKISPENLINGYWVDFYGNNRPYSMYIKTILNNSNLDKENYYRKIIIDDSNFHL